MTQPEDTNDLGFSAESFLRSWSQAMRGETLPLEMLWEDDEPEAAKPWWEKILGTFTDNPAYDEAMQLGQEYRNSLDNSPIDSTES